MSLVKLKVQTSKYYLYQLKVQIYGLTTVAVFAAVAAFCYAADDVNGTVLLLKMRAADVSLCVIPSR